MGRSELEKRLERDLAKTLKAHERLRQDVLRRRGRPPEPGELYLFTFFEEARTEWAIADRQAEEGAALVAVAADLHPAVGSRDLAVETVDGGPLTLRCGVELRLEEGDLDQAVLTGLLPAEAVERARRKLESIHRGELVAGESALDTDVESTYQSWLQELMEERAVLVEHLARCRCR